MKGSCIISLIFFLWCCTSPGNINAQADSSFQYIKTIKGDFTSFSVDNLDNIYVITGSQLRKLNEKGDSICAYNDVKRFGNPSYIDVTNPLKILVYYKNFTTVAVLDRNLSIRNIIDFRKQDIFQVKAIAGAYDNNIWLFDEAENKLKKIDEQGNPLMETTGFNLLFDTVPVPLRVIDRDDFVYLYDPEKGFYIFDHYGSFKSRLPFLDWDNVEVSGKVMYGFSNNILYSYRLNSLDLKVYRLPAFFGDYLAIRVMNGKLYMLRDEGINIYQLK